MRIFPTLTEALDYAAQGQTGFNYYNGRGELTTVLSYASCAKGPARWRAACRAWVVARASRWWRTRIRISW